MTDSGQLSHYGTPRHSGRYPWGSGEQPEQSGPSFLGIVSGLRKQGMSDTAIARNLGMTTTEFRARQSISVTEQRQAKAAQALRLKDKGMSNVAIGKRMGIPESSVRSLLDPQLAERRSSLQITSNELKDLVDQGGYLDIGRGTENWRGISATKLSTAAAMLKDQGYVIKNVQVPQVGTGNKTTIQVLAPPGTTYADIAKNLNQIKTLAVSSQASNHPYGVIEPPVNVSSKRIGIRWAEQGGDQADGVIYVRPGVPDTTLGSSRYAQVRIAVDGTHYLKGMAVYKEGLPPGIDLQFNTSKSDTGNKFDAMKPQKDDKNPFGAVVSQKRYLDSKGTERLSVMNIVNEQGDWTDWRRALSSQVLSKQSPDLARRQLDLFLAEKTEDLDGIMSLTNPVVKKKLLTTFADSADSDAVHLRASPMRGQGTHVILPVEGIKEGDIYAPNYNNGERVVLIRHPHGGPFEIPELRVNNKYPQARRMLGDAPDAVGIHPKVAKRLSGADFDGDAVLVIPNRRREITIAPALERLKNFDPQEEYRGYPGMKPMVSKQQQMGDISNLITDMTIKGASQDEIARAVRHSMVVIDAQNHNLDYKRSYIDNGIESLKEKYQGRHPTGRLRGASTLISRASSEERVPQRKLRSAKSGGSIERTTGRKVYVPTGSTYTKTVVNKRTGESRTVRVTRQVKSTKLREKANARELSSGTPIEEIYASHSNALKSLANRARRESLRTGKIKYSPSAARTYASEVSKLNADLNLALKNAPLERQAQIIANAIIAAKKADNPLLLTDRDALKKENGRALIIARSRVGASKPKIKITSSQWEAIQAGAITTKKLEDILNNADLRTVRVLATPRTSRVLTPAKLAIAKMRLASGYTQAEVANSLDIPVSTLNSALLKEGS